MKHSFPEHRTSANVSAMSRCRTVLDGGHRCRLLFIQKLHPSLNGGHEPTAQTILGGSADDKLAKDAPGLGCACGRWSGRPSGSRSSEGRAATCTLPITTSPAASPSRSTDPCEGNASPRKVVPETKATLSRLGHHVAVDPLPRTTTCACSLITWKRRRRFLNKCTIYPVSQCSGTTAPYSHKGAETTPRMP